MGKDPEYNQKLTSWDYGISLIMVGKSQEPTRSFGPSQGTWILREPCVT